MGREYNTRTHGNGKGFMPVALCVRVAIEVSIASMCVSRVSALHTMIECELNPLYLVCSISATPHLQEDLSL